MSDYPLSFTVAVNHCMLYEVGGFWNVDTEGVRAGLIDTEEHRRSVGYVNDPVDPGGETKYGVAKNANIDLDITALDWDGAQRVYYSRYWLAGACDKITAFAPRVAVLHFDGAVNHGIGRASRFLQAAVNATVDGDIGPGTLSAARAMDEIAICNKICDARVAFYRQIVANNPSQSKYLNGWLRRIVEMRAFVTDTTSSFS